ncbi:MAG TPA: hypothetical protein DDW65_05125 [Firmicutes bacterium]|nr:hypothetical protein [Bacillota bacterium]
MSLHKKHRLILQLVLIMGILLILQAATILLLGYWKLLAEIVAAIAWIFFLGIIITFLALQIIHNFRFERSFHPEKIKITSLPVLKKFKLLNPLENAGIYHKAQLHTHSSLSYDSNVHSLKIIESYKKSGYKILAITDHDVLSDFSTLSTSEMLILPGIEETIPVLFWPIPLGKHMVLINPLEKRPHRQTLQERLNQAVDIDMLVIPAHLSWRGGAGTGRWYPDELYRLKHLQFIEIYNPHSKDPLDLTIWHKLNVRGGPLHPVWGIAVDDSHSGSCGAGWVMLKTPRLDLVSVITNIKKGAFYATNGPSNVDIKVAGTKVYVNSPDSNWIRFINAQNQVTQATRGEQSIYQCSGDEGFIRVEVTDKNHRTAWSQPMWLVAEDRKS